MTKTTVLLSFLTIIGGCSYYSFSGSTLPSHIKTVAVPLFENRTTEYGITDRLTEEIINMLVRDNTLKVVPEGKADSLLRGSIVGYEKEAYTFDENENVREYIVRIYVDASFEDLRKKKQLWQEERLEGWGTYLAQGETEENAQEGAIAKLSEDLVNKLIAGW
jgi:hypothetical protein